MPLEAGAASVREDISITSNAYGAMGVNAEATTDISVIFANADALGTLPGLPPTVQPGDDEAGFTPIVTLATGNVGLGPNVQNPNLINPVTGKIPGGVSRPLDTGKPNTTGSLAGSKFQGTIPAPLQVAFIASALTPSTYNV